MESWEKEDKGTVCDEGNVKGKNHLKKVCEISNERAYDTVWPEIPVCLFINNCNRLIVNMTYAFQDRENLYLVMDLLTGGDLRYHICCQRKFSEEQTSMD